MSMMGLLENACPQPGCERAFGSVLGLEIHLTSVHGIDTAKGREAVTSQPESELERREDVAPLGDAKGEEPMGKVELNKCEPCGKVFSSPQGLSLHRTRVHGATKDRGAKSQSESRPKKRARASAAVVHETKSSVALDEEAFVNERAGLVGRSGPYLGVYLDLQEEAVDVLVALAFLERADPERVAARCLGDALVAIAGHDTRVQQLLAILRGQAMAP